MPSSAPFPRLGVYFISTTFLEQDAVSPEEANQEGLSYNYNQVLGSILHVQADES